MIEDDHIVQNQRFWSTARQWLSEPSFTVPGAMSNSKGIDYYEKVFRVEHSSTTGNSRTLLTGVYQSSAKRVTA